MPSHPTMVNAPPRIELGIPGWALRAWRAGDEANLSRHAGDFAVWRNMSDHFPHPYTWDVAHEWVTAKQHTFGGEHWAIAHDDEAVGGCGVSPGEGHARCNAEIGYWLAPAWWGRGVASRAVRVLTERAFANPAITRVYAPIHAHNTASQRVVEKCGYVREGLQRLSVMKAGRAIDTVTWACYRPGLDGSQPPPMHNLKEPT